MVPCRRTCVLHFMRLYYVPHILGCVAKLAASNAGRETVIADGDFLVYNSIRKRVGAFGHGAHKNADALMRTQALDIVSHSHHVRVEAQSDLSTVGGEMIRDWALDEPQKLFFRIDRFNRLTMQQLHHQPSKPFERARNPDRG